MVTSNRIVQDWGAYLGDNTMSSTIPVDSCTTGTRSNSTAAVTA
ncbi:hypothetical protein LMG28727_07350 [Paraburkholderia kirstenboschensis]|nr:hypothetical protein LMG28727_07350 [Paraburkholderia kirstenboschensis]